MDQIPPTMERCSSTATLWPFFLRRAAAMRPRRPAPITTTSTSSGSGLALRPCSSARLSKPVFASMAVEMAVAIAGGDPLTAVTPDGLAAAAPAKKISHGRREAPEDALRSSAASRTAADCAIGPTATTASGKSTAQRSFSKASTAVASTPLPADAPKRSVEEVRRCSSATSSDGAALAASQMTAARKGVGFSLGPGIGTGADTSRSILVASAAPSTSASSLSHAMSDVMADDFAVVAIPQSVPAMTRDGWPTALTKRSSRSATRAGCSTRAAVVSITPGTITFGASKRPRAHASSKALASCACRGLAASVRMNFALTLATTGQISAAAMSWWCGPA
mmetsp:Transcript_9883/g.31331  ORF Transcript_9883/g.31331 Transcript_9883/m.31331 type:complete len:337 (-) Transcript_9883:618-1628(-)